jgi:ABC-type Fe3+/spermidine/putrescine transport system ATPase subunit
MDGPLGQTGPGSRLMAEKDPPTPAFMVLGQLRKSFGGQSVLTEITLSVEEGEVLVLLGPSGSGKTTLLRLISGFETPDAGEIVVEGDDVTGLPPERRHFGMVFQHYALFPHMTVADNIAFGLESRKTEAAEIKTRIGEVLEMVDLEGFGSRKVQEISGGQQQRVALARALAPQPRLLLLDEPLSNLDPDLRERTRRQLRQAIQRVGLTAIWVTHEQEEAFDVADRVALLENGSLAQVGPPEELYLEPKSRFVAAFVGRASVLTGELKVDGQVEIGDQRYRGHGVCWHTESGDDLEPGQPVEVVFRPEGLRLTGAEEDGALVGEIAERRFTGEATFYLVRLISGETLLVRGRLDGPSIGDRVGVAVNVQGPSPRSFSVAAGDTAS